MKSLSKKCEQAHRPNPYKLALGLLKHPDSQFSGAGHAGRSPEIKRVKRQVFFLSMFLVAVCHADGEVVPTEGRFAAQLKAELINRVSFSARGKTIQIQTKTTMPLPLEFTMGQGLKPSDGVLSAGDAFAWPGCGFDRTSYQVYEIAQKYVVIRYSRGIPEQDGYHDSGVFRVDYEK